MTHHVLVVEDDEMIADVITRYLEREGFTTALATDGQVALQRVQTDPPDVVILDLVLPGLDGLQVCAQLRQRSQLPVLMLTALGDEADRIAGLEVGADDYLTKPFSPRELVLRLRSLLRRTSTADASTLPAFIQDGDLQLHPSSRTVCRAGKTQTLTSREYDLLLFFLRHPNTVITREQLLDEVWNWSFGDSATVTVHVRRLREKIEVDPARPRRLITAWGVGYRYQTTAGP